MLEDYELFVDLCQKYGISSVPEISDAIKASSTTGELRLSTLSIMIPVCKIIAQTLVSSSMIRILDLSDCMLLSKGLVNILDALCQGTTVTTLNLKGNNVSGHLVAQLGRVFSCNNTLKRLYIEWNSLGSDVESFAIFCDGLSKNHNIEQLDLRYNQISPHCAEYLYKAIRGNKSLKNIDLSWNVLGLQGGQLLLNAMHENRTIVRLVLRGNCIPENIMLLIKEHLQKNRHRQVKTECVLLTDVEIATEKNFATSTTSDDTFFKIVHTPWQKLSTPQDEDVRNMNLQITANVLENKNEIKRTVELNSEMNTKLEDDAETGPNAYVNINSKSDDEKGIKVNTKIIDLNEMLKARTATIDLLTNEIATKVTEIDQVRAQLIALQVQINQLQQDKEKYDSDKMREITELQNGHDEAQENWQKSYKALENRYNECLRGKGDAESKIRRYEREIHKNSLQIGMLRDKLVSTTQTYGGFLSKNKTDIHRIKRKSKERDDKHRIEINLLKSTLKDTTQALEDCQTELQKSKNESRGLCKNQTLLKIKLDDAERKTLRIARLEETCRKIEEEKDILEEKLTNSKRIVTSLQRQVTNLRNELIEPQKHYDLLKEKLDLEKQTSERLTQELHEERNRLKDQNLQIEKLNQQIATLNTRLNEVQTIYAELLRERDAERKQFQDIISNKERNLAELRTEEIQRAGQLYAAFSKYLGSIGPSSLS